MNRHDRREETRAINKELTRLKQDPIYLNTLKDEAFADLVRKNELILRDGEYPNTDTQFKFQKAVDFLAKVNQMQERLKVLRGKPK
jgi:hypothetical protein